MGTGTSKEQKIEENVVIQAGNNGAAAANQSMGFSATELISIVTFGIAVAGLVYFIYRICMKKLDRRIRREIAKSTEQLGGRQ